MALPAQGREEAVGLEQVDLEQAQQGEGVALGAHMLERGEGEHDVIGTLRAQPARRQGTAVIERLDEHLGHRLALERADRAQQLDQVVLAGIEHRHDRRLEAQ